MRCGNSAGARCVLGWEWWSIKDAALCRWGRREGWDGQIFRCRGTQFDCCSERCDRCSGTGIHRAIELERWRVGRTLLHRPRRGLAVHRVPFATLAVPECLPRVTLNGVESFVASQRVIHEVRLSWATLVDPRSPSGRHRQAVVPDPKGRKPERWYFDRIRHRRRRGADAAAWALVFLLRWRPWTSPGMWRVVNPESRFRRWPWPWGWLPYLVDRGPRLVLWRLERWSRDVVSWVWAVANRGRGYRVVPGGHLFEVPPFYHVRCCPECWGLLEAEIQGWHIDGTWEPGGLTIGCAAHDPVAMDGTGHRYWQSDWQPVIDAVERWAKANVRVYSGGWPAKGRGS